MNIDRDVWLSEIFGHDVFNVSLEKHRPFVLDVRERIAEHQLLWLNGSCSGRALFYYARVPTHRVDLVQALTQSGFGVVDVNVTLECRPPSTSLRTGPSTSLRTGPSTSLRTGQRQAQKMETGPITAREVLPSEHQAVLDIAGSCFAYSRFHLDPEIPFARAHAIKRAWVASYLNRQRGEKLLVALRDGRPAGFLAVLAAKLEGEACRVIDLIGVDRELQGQGVGKALMRRLIDEASETGILLRVGTQAANLPSIRLYEGLGFRVAETSYVLHSHVKPAEYLG